MTGLKTVRTGSKNWEGMVSFFWKDGTADSSASSPRKPTPWGQELALWGLRPHPVQAGIATTASPPGLRATRLPRVFWGGGVVRLRAQDDRFWKAAGGGRIRQ